MLGDGDRERPLVRRLRRASRSGPRVHAVLRGWGRGRRGAAALVRAGQASPVLRVSLAVHVSDRRGRRLSRPIPAQPRDDERSRGGGRRRGEEAGEEREEGESHDKTSERRTESSELRRDEVGRWVSVHCCTVEADNSQI